MSNERECSKRALNGHQSTAQGLPKYEQYKPTAAWVTAFAAMAAWFTLTLAGCSVDETLPGSSAKSEPNQPLRPQLQSFVDNAFVKAGRLTITTMPELAAFYEADPVYQLASTEADAGLASYELKLVSLLLWLRKARLRLFNTGRDTDLARVKLYEEWIEGALAEPVQVEKLRGLVHIEGGRDRMRKLADEAYETFGASCDANSDTVKRDPYLSNNGWATLRSQKIAPFPDNFSRPEEFAKLQGLWFPPYGTEPGAVKEKDATCLPWSSVVDPTRAIPELIAETALDVAKLAPSSLTAHDHWFEGTVRAANQTQGRYHVGFETVHPERSGVKAEGVVTFAGAWVRNYNAVSSTAVSSTVGSPTGFEGFEITLSNTNTGGIARYYLSPELCFDFALANKGIFEIANTRLTEAYNEVRRQRFPPSDI